MGILWYFVILVCIILNLFSYFMESDKRFVLRHGSTCVLYLLILFKVSVLFGDIKAAFVLSFAVSVVFVLFRVDLVLVLSGLLIYSVFYALLIMSSSFELQSVYGIMWVSFPVCFVICLSFYDIVKSRRR